jgi:hypothetical protein
LIDYLDVIKTPHQNTSDQDKLYNDFRSFYEQYDQRRGKNFRIAFPDFVEFIDGIQFVEAEAPLVIDPATTADGYVSDEVAAHGWDTKNDTLGKNETD